MTDVQIQRERPRRPVLPSLGPRTSNREIESFFDLMLANGARHFPGPTAPSLPMPSHMDGVAPVKEERDGGLHVKEERAPDAAQTGNPALCPYSEAADAGGVPQAGNPKP